MKKYIARLLLLLLFPIAMFLNYIASLNPVLVENIYSTKINKWTIIVLSKFTNFIPFSLYEFSIITAVLVVVTYLIYTVIKIIKNYKKWVEYLINFILNCSVAASILFFLFITLWTINYNRVPIDVTLGIERTTYSVNELTDLYNYLIDNVNRLREEVPVDENNIATTSGDSTDVLNRAIKGYDAVSDTYTTLSGNYGSPKPLFFSEFFNYAGITGIYMPYTAQAGVSIKAPTMTIPATTLHEMAHQRGYAHEEEANFISFITAINHPDVDFQYSGYMLALTHTNNAIYREDPELLKTLNSRLSEDVKRDMNYKNQFWKSYEGKINEVSTNINDTYLKSNGVSDGEKSYGRVVDLLISYYLKVLK